MFGSVAEKVSKLATVPVMLVKCSEKNAIKTHPKQ
jgi:hypothetical protein